MRRLQLPSLILLSRCISMHSVPAPTKASLKLRPPYFRSIKVYELPWDLTDET